MDLQNPHLFYNFEHEDIHFPALINHQMVESIIELFVYIIHSLSPVASLVASLVATLIASVYTILYVGCYINIPAILKWAWSFLTPGQEYIEIIYILSSLLASGFCLYLSIKMLKGIEKHLDNVKKERKELQDQIEELERENDEMKNTFRLMVSYANPNVMDRKKVKQIKN